MRPLSHRFVVYNTEKRSQMCEIHFVWSCPTWPSRWGMRISIDWPRLKSCQAVCDACTRGAICSGQSRDAGCFDMWDWPESCATKIWGLSHDHGFVLFLFATMGFHIARPGIFWTPTFVYSLAQFHWHNTSADMYFPDSMFTQSSAVIAQSNIVRYCINDCRNSGRISLRWWIHKIHPITCPNGRAMGCLLWTFFRELAAL